MTHDRSTAVNLSASDEELIRQARCCGDPLVEDLCRRLGEAIDRVDAVEGELSSVSLSHFHSPGRDPTDSECDQIADMILRAAGSKLAYYTVPKIRDEIRAATRCAIEDVFDADGF